MSKKARLKPASAPPPARSPRRRPAPRTVEELTAQNVAAIQQLESAALSHAGLMDAVADRIAHFAGSALFLAMHVVWFAAWIAINVSPGIGHFDPFPFTFLTLVVSLEAIFLSSFILISQKRAALISERRNQLDLQINLLTEQENTRMLKVLGAIATKLGVSVSDDPSTEVLEQATRPDKLVEQIDRAQQATDASAADKPTGLR
ncbi:MAG: DUF1003 domain-containing protein [Caldimonas sp.]